MTEHNYSLDEIKKLREDNEILNDEWKQESIRLFDAKKEIERLKAELETAKEKWRYWEIDMFYPAQLRARAAEDVAHHYHTGLEARINFCVVERKHTVSEIEKRLAELKTGIESHYYHENSNGEMMTREENEKRQAELKAEKK